MSALPSTPPWPNPAFEIDLNLQAALDLHSSPGFVLNEVGARFEHEYGCHKNENQKRASTRFYLFVGDFGQYIVGSSRFSDIRRRYFLLGDV